MSFFMDYLPSQGDPAGWEIMKIKVIMKRFASLKSP